MFGFPIEITIYIASLHKDTWINLVLLCSDFKAYAFTSVGKRQFLKLFTDIVITPEKTTYYVFDKIHRNDDETGDKPTVIWADGSRSWYINGELHRPPCSDADDRPTVICSGGSLYWHSNGKLHRGGDKPAVIHTSGAQYWYINGNLHRYDDKPAIVWPDGSQYWYVNGKHHRDSDANETDCKPTSILADGTLIWCVNGKQYRSNNNSVKFTGQSHQQWYVNEQLIS